VVVVVGGVGGRNLSLVRRGAAPRSQAFVSVISGWSE